LNQSLTDIKEGGHGSGEREKTQLNRKNFRGKCCVTHSKKKATIRSGGKGRSEVERNWRKKDGKNNHVNFTLGRKKNVKRGGNKKRLEGGHSLWDLNWSNIGTNCNSKRRLRPWEE